MKSDEVNFYIFTECCCCNNGDKFLVFPQSTSGLNNFEACFSMRPVGVCYQLAPSGQVKFIKSTFGSPLRQSRLDTSRSHSVLPSHSNNSSANAASVQRRCAYSRKVLHIEAVAWRRYYCRGYAWRHQPAVSAAGQSRLSQWSTKSQLAESIENGRTACVRTPFLVTRRFGEPDFSWSVINGLSTNSQQFCKNSVPTLQVRSQSQSGISLIRIWCFTPQNTRLESTPEIEFYLS